MRFKFHAARGMWLAALLLWLPLPALAQTHFHVTMPAGAAGDFDQLVTFPTPTGTGADRKTMVRVVSSSPVAGVRFRVAQAPPATGKTSADIPVDGALATIDVTASGEPVTFI